MPVMITRAQRNAIYEMVINHLTGTGDLWLAVQRRDFADAKRLGRMFAEDLRLLEDLDWSETIDHEAVTLKMPPGELTRTLARLHKDAAGALGTYVSRPKADEEFAQRDLAASEALGEILSRLAEPTDDALDVTEPSLPHTRRVAAKWPLKPDGCAGRDPPTTCGQWLAARYASSVSHSDGSGC